MNINKQSYFLKEKALCIKLQKCVFLGEFNMKKEALKALTSLAENCAVKILKIDLDTGYQETLFLAQGERTPISCIFQDNINDILSNNLIHFDYTDAFKHLYDIEYLNKYFKFKKYLHFKYLRASRVGEEYYQAVTTVLKSEDEENKVYSITYDLSGV